MGLLDNHLRLTRALFAVIAAALGAGAVVTFINYAGSPTDENLFAAVPHDMSLCVTRSIACAGAGPGAVPDTIRPGELIDQVNGRKIADSTSLRDALAAGGGALTIHAYRPSSLEFHDYTVARSDFPDTPGTFLKNFIAVVDVTKGGASDRAGMKVGDLLLRINGQGFTTALEADLILRRGQTGKTILYEALRAGAPIDLHVTLARFGMPLALLILSFSGMFMLALGGFIAIKRPGIRAARITGMALLMCGYFIAVTAIRREVDRDLFVVIRDLLTSVSIIAGFSLAMRSLAYFPKERPDLLAKRWIGWTYGIATLALIVLSFFKLGTVVNTGLIALVLFHAVIVIVYRRRAGAEHRRMGAPIYWAWGALGAYLIGLILYQVFVSPNNQSLNTVFGIAVLVLGVTLSYIYVIGRYRLLDLNFRIRRNIQYTLVSVAWGLLMAAVLVNIFLSLPSVDLHLPMILIHGSTIEAVDEPATGAAKEWTNRLGLIAVGVGVWYLLWRLRKAGQSWIDRKFYRGRYDYRQAVSELGEVLATKLSLADLGGALTAKIAELMRVKRAGVFFFRGEQVSACREAYGIGAGAWSDFCGRAEHGLAGVLTGAGEHVYVDYLPESLKQLFRAHEFYLIVPVRSRERLLGAIVLGEKLSEATYRREDYEFLTAAAGQSAVAIENAFLYEELAEQERMKHELAIARRIQLASLPQKTPVVSGLEIAGVSIPALEVGGDFFDYLNGSTDRLTVVVGDVSGKGTSAALYMSKVQGILRSLHGFGLSPAELFVRANRLLCGDMEKSSFVTAVGASFDPRARTFLLARAGHLPLYHYRSAERRVIQITPRGLGLGLNNAGVFSSEIEEKVISYAPGDVLLFVTDGVTEAHSSGGELFGEERLIEVLAGGAGGDAAAIRDDVIRALGAFSEGASQHDDETIVVIKGQ
ncbi:MAG TPA: SpoIIE family protein phosphatase [Bacteroidota bacterium]|nr:SpoIIE family protein phosphatase [Bacteroidota bacterium]